MKKYERFESRVVLLPFDNVDTDQIIPARFLKTVSREGLEALLFHDWRYDEEGRPRPGFVLNRPEARRARILLAGDNFGCGSSREHAPWALTQFGFRAVISTSFADIFRQNALKNGLLPIAVSPQVHSEILDAITRNPDLGLTVDLDALELRLPDGRAVSFAVDPFSRQCLLEGADEIGYVLNRDAAIAAFEAARQAPVDTLREPSA
ncbi:MAG: 3-isopropylmalate dehydratase small subunit [Acidobacteriota bacterium]